MRSLLFALLVLAPGLAVADPATLDGDFTQGGLLVGRAHPGSSVRLDGQALPVTADGLFLVGFGRDAAGTGKLTVMDPQGDVETRLLSIVSRVYKVQRIDGLPGRKVTPKPEDLARIRTDNALIGDVRARTSKAAYFTSGFGWPVEGTLTGVFGSQRILNGKPKNPHNGADIAAAEGTLIVAPADGVAALAADDMFYTGMTVMLDHGLGLTSVYAHMSDILVKPGAMVKRGDPIGRVGATGRVTGAHLHWGVTLGKTHLDPELLLD